MGFQNLRRHHNYVVMLELLQQLESQEVVFVDEVGLVRLEIRS